VDATSRGSKVPAVVTNANGAADAFTDATQRKRKYATALSHGSL